MPALHLPAAFFLAAATLYSQTAATPQFEVASIKPSLSPPELRAKGQRPPATGTDAARVQLYMSLSGLIRRAYRLEPYQKLTGPDWMESEFFEVAAKLPDGATQAQAPQMLQSLLADRFKLVVRRDSKEEAVYLLTVAKSGPKLKESAPDASAASKWDARAGGRTPIVRSGTANGWQTYSHLNSDIVFDSNKISLPELATALRHEVDLPVLDKTGLSGSYEVSLPVPGLWIGNASTRPATADGAGAASDPAGVDIFKSVEKLGLKLEKGKAPLEHLVVEHLEKTPTEN